MSIVRFENLPNEFFLEFFRYFSLDELLSIFIGLNRRFDQLISSLSYLTYFSRNDYENQLDSFRLKFIRRCVVRHPQNDEFWSKISSHIQHLHVDYITNEYFQSDFPQLECLIVDRRVHPLYIDEMRRRIFSNHYPKLKRCSISRISLSSVESPWTGSTSIRILRLNRIDRQIFLEILSVCPNLIELKVEIHQTTTNDNWQNSFRHEKLRRFRLHFIGDDERILENFLFCLPQVESFRVNRSCSIEFVQRSIEFFSDLFRRTLPVLCQFVFNVKFFRSTYPNEFERNNLFYQWKKHFYRNDHFQLNLFS